MQYKVLTLTQPWATLIAIGAKHIETRSWATSYRGPLAIHAAAGLGPVGGERALQRLCQREPFWSALRPILMPPGHMYFAADVLPRGAIVAVAKLFKCIAIEDGLLSYQAPGVDWWIITGQERAFGDYTPGRYAWLLTNVRRLSEPIPARGQLGLWTWEGDLPL